MIADYNGWADQPEEEREALDQLEMTLVPTASTRRHLPALRGQPLSSDGGFSVLVRTGMLDSASECPHQCPHLQTVGSERADCPLGHVLRTRQRGSNRMVVSVVWKLCEAQLERGGYF